MGQAEARVAVVIPAFNEEDTVGGVVQVAREFTPEVVVASDGWERGEPDLLREQMRRVRRVAHAVVWANPHRGKEGYEPVQQGVVAALPFCDDFVAGHSLASFAELAEVIERA